MTNPFSDQIAEALGTAQAPEIAVDVQRDAELPSCFPTSDLAVASLEAVGAELAAETGAERVTLNRRHGLMWFHRTLKPKGWSLPSQWDAIAGAYQTQDGWIRLHTNAPHHREAALRVLDCASDRDAVANAVSQWTADALEAAVVAAQGAAAAMHAPEVWREHPQGQAVAEEPLIAWRQTAEGAPPVRLCGAKVLDLTRVLAGPVATRVLAGFGAQVLRIDPPWWNEPAVEPEVTLGKVRAGLDLTQDEDRTRFEVLLSQADILVHGYRGDALAGLGYDSVRLRKIAPWLIDVSLTAYGATGPWADRRGFDSLVQMSCGLAAEGQRLAGADGPVPLPVQALDHATGYLMAAAVLRALRIRRQTGLCHSARLSLARTAALLMSHGSHPFRGIDILPEAEDFDASMEQTGWGPAQRIRFPLQLDGTGPQWTIPAGPLRIASPAWL